MFFLKSTLSYYSQSYFFFKEMCGAVTGLWIVNFNEATCVTWWDGYYDKVLLFNIYVLF